MIGLRRHVEMFKVHLLFGCVGGSLYERLLSSSPLNRPVFVR